MDTRLSDELPDIGEEDQGHTFLGCAHARCHPGVVAPRTIVPGSISVPHHTAPNSISSQMGCRSCMMGVAPLQHSSGADMVPPLPVLICEATASTMANSRNMVASSGSMAAGILAVGLTSCPRTQKGMGVAESSLSVSQVARMYIGF